MTTELFGENGDTSTPKGRGIRSATLSVNFVDGHAAGWFMAVPECFRSALDIEMTERVHKDPVTGKKSKKSIWTEGQPQIFKFATGDMLHDIRIRHEGEWGDAMRDISVGLKVARAVPDELGEGTTKISGWVSVAVYRPRPDRSLIHVVATHRMTQTEFVHLLKTGRLPDGTRLER